MAYKYMQFAQFQDYTETSMHMAFMGWTILVVSPLATYKSTHQMDNIPTVHKLR